MSIYELFDKGLTKEEFNSTKQKLLDDLCKDLYLNPPGSKERINLAGRISRLRMATYRKYFDCTHVMTPEGIKEIK